MVRRDNERAVEMGSRSVLPAIVDLPKARRPRPLGGVGCADRTGDTVLVASPYGTADGAWRPGRSLQLNYAGLLLDEPTTPASVRHIIVLIIANTFWAAGATAQSMSPNRRVRAVSAAQLAGTGRAPAEYGARGRDDARRLSMGGDLRRRGPLRWCPLHALQPEHHDRYRQFVGDVASRAARRRSLAGDLWRRRVAPLRRPIHAVRHARWAVERLHLVPVRRPRRDALDRHRWWRCERVQPGPLHPVHDRRWPAEQSRASHR